MLQIWSSQLLAQHRPSYAHSLAVNRLWWESRTKQHGTTFLSTSVVKSIHGEHWWPVTGLLLVYVFYFNHWAKIMNPKNFLRRQLHRIRKFNQIFTGFHFQMRHWHNVRKRQPFGHADGVERCDQFHWFEGTWTAKACGWAWNDSKVLHRLYQRFITLKRWSEEHLLDSFLSGKICFYFLYL